MISLPVASPSAWTMRSWLCPPSRPERQSAADVVELRAPVDQFADPQGGLAHHVLDHRRIAERAAGFERVGHVVLDAVVRLDHGGHPALSVVAIGLPNPLLGDDHDREPGIDGQRRPQTGQPAADHQHVGKEVRHALGMERDQVSRDGRGHRTGNWGLGGGRKPCPIVNSRRTCQQCYYFLQFSKPHTPLLAGSPTCLSQDITRRYNHSRLALTLRKATR